jgi:hypothetical protein
MFVFLATVAAAAKAPTAFDFVFGAVSTSLETVHKGYSFVEVVEVYALAKKAVIVVGVGKVVHAVATKVTRRAPVKTKKVGKKRLKSNRPSSRGPICIGDILIEARCLWSRAGSRPLRLSTASYC